MIGYGVAQDEIDWAAVRDALEAQAADTRHREPVLARAARADPARFAALSAEAILPAKREAAARRDRMREAGERRAGEASARQAAAAQRSAANLTAMVDRRLADLGIVPPAKI